MVNTIDTTRIQYVAIVGSVLLFALIFQLIRRRHLKEEYAILWLCFCVVFLFFSVSRTSLHYFGALLGIAYPPAALLLVLLMAFFLVLIQFSIVISRLSGTTTELSQRVGILQMRLSEMKKTSSEAQK